jgi:hypothetical protein
VGLARTAAVIRSWANPLLTIDYVYCRGSQAAAGGGTILRPAIETHPSASEEPQEATGTGTVAETEIGTGENPSCYLHIKRIYSPELQRRPTANYGPNRELGC